MTRQKRNISNARRLCLYTLHGVNFALLRCTLFTLESKTPDVRNYVT